MKKILRLLSVLLVIFGMTSLGLYLFSSDDLDIVYYDYTSEQVPASFDGFTMVQLTDMHNHSIEYGNTNLIDEIDAINPDAVLITGDMIDSHTKNLNTQTDLFEGLAPFDTYYVNGNHEVTSRFLSEFQTLTQTYSVHNLNRVKATLTRGTDSIYLIGVDDGLLKQRGLFGYEDTGLIKQSILDMTEGMDDSALTIALAHRPRLYQNYIDTSMDFVFSGHYHGSQIRFFGIGFARLLSTWYEGAMHTIDKTTFITSAGLGYSVAPIRINCNAQLVVTTLHSA